MWVHYNLCFVLVTLFSTTEGDKPDDDTIDQKLPKQIRNGSDAGNNKSTLKTIIGINNRQRPVGNRQRPVGNHQHHQGRRKLHYQPIAGYVPISDVNDHSAIDLDQKAIESFLSIETAESFDQARAVYEQGGHSKSYARLTLSNPTAFSFYSGSAFVGLDTLGNEVTGEAYKTDSSGNDQLWLKYSLKGGHQIYLNCQVGGLANTQYMNLDGCFAPAGRVTEYGTSNELEYSYNPVQDTSNARTIQGFSLAVERKMLTCPHCPHTDAKYFYDYYGIATYADIWIQAALAGKDTDFPSGNGNADFSTYSYIGRAEAVKKACIVMNIFMYVIREMEDALDDCKHDCIHCNDDPIHSFEEAVALYTGSLEGEEGHGQGKLLYALADKRCADFGTCNSDYGTGGTSNVNNMIFELFNSGRLSLENGQCDDARVIKNQIVQAMYIPLIQSTLRYARFVSEQIGGEKAKAEGAIFSASVLPLIHSMKPEAAEVIYSNMATNSTSTSFAAVKEAFESVYVQINITCSDIGGIVDFGSSYYTQNSLSYFEGAEPCEDTISQPPKCVDSPLKMITNGRRKGCNCVKKNGEKRCNDQKVAKHCPLSCHSHVNSCAFQCRDSAKKFYVKETLSNKTCKFIRTGRKKRRERLCGKEGVRQTCRKTCDYCEAWSG